MGVAVMAGGAAVDGGAARKSLELYPLLAPCIFSLAAGSTRTIRTALPPAPRARQDRPDSGQRTTGPAIRSSPSALKECCKSLAARGPDAAVLAESRDCRPLGYKPAEGGMQTTGANSLIRKASHLTHRMDFRDPVLSQEVRKLGTGPLLMAGHPLHAVAPFFSG